MNYLNFRNCAAEQGHELTPVEAKEMIDSYNLLKNRVEEAYKENPYFYMHIKNLTTEQKFERMERLKKHGIDIGLQELNKTIKIILNVCESEGYD